MRAQAEPVPVVRAGLPRRGNSHGGAVRPNGRFTAGAQASAQADDPRYVGNVNDSAIRRDRIAWFPTDARSGVGTGTVDWTAAGPARPELHMRNVTVRTMAGTSRTRALASPFDPTIGLHSQTVTTPRGNVERFKATGVSMKGARTDRLSPARYSGQSYSQTTLLQGARR